MVEEISIQQCVAGQENALSLVGQATFLEAFAGVISGQAILGHCANAHAASVYRAWLDDERCKIWMATIDPDYAPVGYVVLAPAELPIPDLAADDLEIKRIYLLHRFQGNGLGKRLLAKAIEQAQARKVRRLLLGVYAQNDDAIGFYQRQGFRKVGTRTFNVGGKTYNDLVMGLDV